MHTWLFQTPRPTHAYASSRTKVQPGFNNSFRENSTIFYACGPVTNCETKGLYGVTAEGRPAISTEKM